MHLSSMQHTVPELSSIQRIAGARHIGINQCIPNCVLYLKNEDLKREEVKEFASRKTEVTHQFTVYSKITSFNSD